MNNVRLLTIISAFCFVATGISSILTSLYLQSLGASFSNIAFVQASVVITMLVASYAWGRFSDRLGRRKPILVVGLAVLAIAYFFLSQAPTSGWAWAARVLEGVGSAAYATLSLAMMGDALAKENQKGRRIGVWRGLGSLSFAIGATAGGWLADQTSMSQTLLICVGLYAIATVCALALRDAEPAAIQPASVSPAVPLGANQGPHRTLFSRFGWSAGQKAAVGAQGLPLAFLGGVFFWVCAHSASASMWPNYMASFGYTSSASGLLWGMAALVELFAMQRAGVLSDRVGRPPLLIAGGLGISLTNLGYLALAHIFPALLVVQLIRGIGFGSYTTAAMTFAAESGDHGSRGSKSGLFHTTMSAGQLFGTLIAGNLVQFLGFGALYGACAVLAFTSAVCFWVLRRRTAPVLASAS
jgi:MFS family permease